MKNEQAFFLEALSSGLNLSLTGFEEYLRDESRFVGFATGFIKARHENDVITSIALANRFHTPLTVVSGKTSITGASAPHGGVILSVRDLNDVDENDFSLVGPGAILKDYKKLVESKGFFYPPDPTSEDSCCIGGTIACNASGSLSYLYGPTRDYIQGLRVVLPSGIVLNIARGEVFAENGVFRTQGTDSSGRPVTDLTIPAPAISQAPWKMVKNAAGLFSQDKMDLIDLFIGGEGVLGVILQARTKLLAKRYPYFALMIFTPSRKSTVALVRTLDRLKKLFHDKSCMTSGNSDLNQEPFLPDDVEDLTDFRKICPSCMEWFGASTSSLLGGDRGKKIEQFYGALYVEQEYSDDEDMSDKLTQWSKLIDFFNISDALGPMQTEAAVDAKHLRALRQDRIRIPERLNELIKPGLRKIGTDLSVSMEKLDLLMKLYDEKLPKGISYIFGHIGNAHLHANIVARNPDEIKQFTDLHQELARYVCSIGGSVSGEHGIGKLKKELLKTMIGEHGINEIRKVKTALDPFGILNPGNIID